jgi:hypothetical protein
MKGKAEKFVNKTVRKSGFTEESDRPGINSYIRAENTSFVFNMVAIYLKKKSRLGINCGNSICTRPCLVRRTSNSHVAITDRNATPCLKVKNKGENSIRETTFPLKDQQNTCFFHKFK